MARTTISLSEALKKRMDRVKGPVNWSAVAAEAFELKLGELARKQEVKTMDTVIARLRASKIQNASADEKDGRVAGKEWAEATAELAELRRVAKIDIGQFFDESNWTVSSGYCAAEILAFTIIGAKQPFIRSEAKDFWESVVGSDPGDNEQLDSLDFLFGFTAGAQDFFEQVEPLL